MRRFLNPSAHSPASVDTVLLLIRLALGVILVAHGWQKLTEWTVTGTAQAFSGMGIPAPTASAVFAIVAELGGGAALILGVLTPIAAALNVLNLVGAFVFVHAGKGVFVAQGGFELVLALIAALLAVLVLGAGRFSVDRFLGSRSEHAQRATPVYGA